MLGKGFRSGEYTHERKIGKFDLYLTIPGVVNDIGEAETGLEVGLGHIVQVENDTVVYSVGANPCITGVVVDQKGKLHVLHSAGNILTREQKVSIINAADGIIGGGLETLQTYQVLITQSKVRIIRSEDPEADMNVAVVLKKVSDIPRGVFYDLSL